MVCLRSLGTNPLSALRWSNSGRMLHNDRPASPGWAYETPSTLPRCRMVDAVGVATLALHIVGQSIRFRDQIHQRRQALSILGAKMERVYISLLESNAAGTAPFERDILSPIIDQSFALLQRAESRSGRRKRICRALRPEDDIALAHELSRAFDNALMQIELYRLSCKVDTSVRLASAPRPNENCGDPATHILPTAIEVVPGTQGPTFNRCNSVYSGDHLLNHIFLARISTLPFSCLWPIFSSKRRTFLCRYIPKCTRSSIIVSFRFGSIYPHTVPTGPAHRKSCLNRLERRDWSLLHPTRCKPPIPQPCPI